MALFDIETLILFCLHLALAGPPVQCCVGAVVCAVKGIEKLTLLSGGSEGENVSKELENRIVLP